MKKQFGSRGLSFILAVAMVLILIGGTGLMAFAAEEGTSPAGEEQSVSSEVPSGADEPSALSGVRSYAISPGDVITAGGTYELPKDGSLGTVTVDAPGQEVVIEGSGVGWHEVENENHQTTLVYDDGVYEYQNLHFDCAEGTHLTLKSFFLSDSDDSSPMFNFTGRGNELTIEDHVVLDMHGRGAGTYALCHVGKDDNTELTIDGDGILYLYKESGGSGFGGNSGELNGEITFGNPSDSALTMFAKGTKQGALIGAGTGASNKEDAGAIRFESGMYNLEANGRGAVIGGSAGSEGATKGADISVDKLANININVDWSGSAVGGGGYDGGNDSSGGTLTVDGGSLRCYIDANAAGNTTGWLGREYTQGLDDAAITAKRVNGRDEPVYWLTFNTADAQLDTESHYDVTVDGVDFYSGTLPEYGFVQEGLDKGEQLEIDETVSNWYKNGNTYLCFYLTGKEHLLTINGISYLLSFTPSMFDEDTGEVIAGRFSLDYDSPMEGVCAVNTDGLTGITNSGAIYATKGEDYETTLKAQEGYELPEIINVRVDGELLEAGDDYIYDPSSGALKIYATKVTGTIVISREETGAPQTFDPPTIDAENVDFEPVTEGNPTYGTNYEVRLTPWDGYELTVDDITVTAGDNRLTAGKDYIYADDILTIMGEAITGDIIITATATKEPEPTPTSETVEVAVGDMDHVTFEGQKTATLGEDYAATLKPADGYQLTAEDITVTSGDKTLKAGEDYTYDASTGTLTVKADTFTEGLAISATATKEPEPTPEPTGKNADTLVARRGQVYYFSYSIHAGEADLVTAYGKADDTVLFGDWDGDGVDTYCVRRGAEYYFRNSLTSGDADEVIVYGRPDDEVLVGDWDGDGKDTIAVRRGRIYYLSNSLRAGDADEVIVYGREADDVIVGDWDGDGKDTPAVRRGAQYFFQNNFTGGEAEYDVVYGHADDVVLVGDWDGDGRDTLAVRRGARYYFKNSISAGDADEVVVYGKADDEVYAGCWQ